MLLKAIFKQKYTNHTRPTYELKSMFVVSKEPPCYLLVSLVKQIFLLKDITEVFNWQRLQRKWKM